MVSVTKQFFLHQGAKCQQIDIAKFSKISPFINNVRKMFVKTLSIKVTLYEIFINPFYVKVYNFVK